MAKRARGTVTAEDVERLDEQERLDDYKNELTGFGDWRKDKTLGGRPGPLDFILIPITGPQAEVRWRGDPLGGRIVEIIPEEMTRAGYDIVIKPDEDDEEPTEIEGEEGSGPSASPEKQEGDKPEEKQTGEIVETDDFGGAPPFGGGAPPAPKEPGEVPDFTDEGVTQAEALMGQLEELCADDRLFEALCYERAYGGGAVLIGANDGQTDLSKPLDMERIKSVDFLTSFTGGPQGELTAWSYYDDPSKQNYGEVEIYMLRNLSVPPALPVGASAQRRAAPMPQMIQYIHASRLLVFGSMPVSRKVKIENSGWGDSIFTRIDKVLADYGQTWGGISILMSELSIATLAIEGLAQKFAAGNKASQGSPLTTRAMQMKLAKSIANMLLIDSKETFKRETASMSGVAEVIVQMCLRVAAAAGMPVSLLMGQAPAGLNATGASDVVFFQSSIGAKQRKRLLPQLRRLIRILMSAKDGPTQGVEPEKWSINFRPLYQPSSKEKAEERKVQAETDQIYANIGAVSPEEIAGSRFGGSEYSTETTIDFEGRRKVAEIEKEKAAVRAKAALENPPPPPPSAPPAGEQAPPPGEQKPASVNEKPPADDKTEE